MTVDVRGADVMALDDMADVGGVLLTPSHQFPLGVSLHSDRYDRSPVGALQGVDPDHVIYMGTASKSLAPRLRLGWLLLPERLVDAVARQKGETEETSVW